jgi:hypothetical protein
MRQVGVRLARRFQLMFLREFPHMMALAGKEED